MNFLKKILNENSNINFHMPNVVNLTMGKSMSLMEYAQLVSDKYNDIYNQKVIIKFDEKLIQKFLF